MSKWVPMGDGDFSPASTNHSSKRLPRQPGLPHTKASALFAGICQKITSKNCADDGCCSPASSKGELGVVVLPGSVSGSLCAGRRGVQCREWGQPEMPLGFSNKGIKQLEPQTRLCFRPCFLQNKSLCARLTFTLPKRWWKRITKLAPTASLCWNRLSWHGTASPPRDAHSGWW